MNLAVYAKEAEAGFKQVPLRLGWLLLFMHSWPWACSIMEYMRLSEGRNNNEEGEPVGSSFNQLVEESSPNHRDGLS